MKNERQKQTEEEAGRMSIEHETEHKKERLEHFFHDNICRNPEFQREFEKGKEFRLQLNNLLDALLDAKAVASGKDRGSYHNIQERVEYHYHEIQRIISTLDDDLRPRANEIMKNSPIGDGYKFYLDNKKFIEYLEKDAKERERDPVLRDIRSKPKPRVYYMPLYVPP